MEGFRSRHPRPVSLLVGFEGNSDAGVFSIGRQTALVQSVDIITPVSDNPRHFGEVAVANALADIYASGALPLTVMNICCFPKDLSQAILAAILEGALEKTEEAGAALLGGHTIKDEELKFGLAVTGIVHSDRLLTNSRAKAGDQLILTKPIGTGVCISALRQGRIAPLEFEPVYESMRTLNSSAATLARRHSASACTDISGFGIVGHALEMAEASRVSIHLFTDRIPTFKIAEEAASEGVMTSLTEANRSAFEPRVSIRPRIESSRIGLLFDPQTSGGLLIATPEGGAKRLVEDLGREGCFAAEIGLVTSREATAVILE